MRKITTLLVALGVSFYSNAQTTFWTENFTSGTGALPYAGSNGTWNFTVLTPEGAAANRWYVSCTEGGKISGACGAICATGDLGATLHLGSDPTVGGDLGAAYFTGGCFTYTTYFGSVYTYGICAATDKRAESPAINCSSKLRISLSYYYIENGDATNDNGTVWYYDGTSWSLLEDPPKSTICGGGQGTWAKRTVALPASADNNPNVKIGFRWENNEDGFGTDPSFAVDSVSLSTAPPPVASYSMNPVSGTVCQDSCITFTSTSVGTVDSVRWAVLGAVPVSPTSPSTSICFTSPGTYFVRMYVYGPGAADSVVHTITVNPAPHVTITHPSGRLLSVPTGYTMYQWAKGLPIPIPIAGATSRTYTYTSSGTYWVLVDSAGCLGGDSITISPVSVPQVGTQDNRFWVTSVGEHIILNAAKPLDYLMMINIFDIGGRELYNGTWPAGLASQQVSGIVFPPGMYTIRLTNEKSSEVLKWVAP